LDSEFYLSARAKIANGDGSDLTPIEIIAYNESVVIDLISLDNAFYQNANGYVSDEYWQGRQRRTKNNLQEERTREIFSNYASQGTSAFSLYINELLAEAEAAAAK
jgi:hypothetical protein